MFYSSVVSLFLSSVELFVRFIFFCSSKYFPRDKSVQMLVWVRPDRGGSAVVKSVGGVDLGFGLFGVR